MAAAGVPTALARVCTTPEEVAAALDAFGPPYVVKDDGLAAGKGVVVTDDRDAAAAHAAQCDAGRDRGVPRRPGGVAVRDHRRLDGLPAPARPGLQADLRRRRGAEHRRHGCLHAAAVGAGGPRRRGAAQSVLQPTVDEMARRGAPFAGLLYAGLALTSRGVRVVEFNARFGDPETQPLLALLDSPLAALLKGAADGDLHEVDPPRWKQGAAVAVVMASAGYPESSSKGDVIVGTETLAEEADVDVIHAGTAERDGAPGHRRRPGARRDRGRHGRRRRPGQGLRGRLLDQLRRRPVAHRHRRASVVDREDLRMTVPNVLATRYAGADLAEIWSPEHKIVLERRLWIAVLTAQRDLGVDVPDGVIADYEAVVDKVDLASIAARERVTRHDVKARIEEFCALAGHEHIHKGMTSRDLTENVEQLQIRASLGLVRAARARHAGPAGPARGRARVAGDGRALAQRRRPGDHPRQAVRHRGRRDAGRARSARRPAGALPAARHQGPDGHLPGHARPARRRHRPARRPRAAGGARTSASSRC